MKKALYVILVIMLALLLCACANSGTAERDEAKEPALQNEAGTSETQGPTENEIDNEDVPAQNNVKDPNESVEHSIDMGQPSIAGISLGDPVSKVEMILGENYEETLHEEMGHFDESYYLREYEGISFIIGKDSQEVLEIDVTSDEYETWLGDKVGDTAGVVLPKYREKYTEPESIHSDGKLEGWFELGDGLVLIFDFDKDDGMIINPDITEDSKVEVIKLADMRYMD